MILVIAPAAEAQLEAIFAYGVSHWGWDRAEAYADALIDAFDRIADRTVPWRPLEAAFGIDGYRHRYGRHIIYWRATEVEVTIVAILHERMDQGNRLRDALEP